jgi:hypothetical protein
MNGADCEKVASFEVPKCSFFCQFACPATHVPIQLSEIVSHHFGHCIGHCNRVESLALFLDTDDGRLLPTIRDDEKTPLYTDDPWLEPEYPGLEWVQRRNHVQQ